MPEQLPPHVRARVVGVLAVRDSFSKESIQPGGVVRLVERKPTDPRPPANSVIVEALVSAGSIEVLDEKPEPKGKP